MSTPLLLLPGTLCDERLFAHQVKALAAGRPVQVGDLTRSDTIAGLADDVLDEAPARFALAGLSLGGIVAMEIMRREPERVERLALLDTNPRPATPMQIETWDRFAEMVAAGRFSDITPMLMPMLAWRVEELGELIVAMAENIGPDAFLRQNAAQPTRPDSRPTLADISCPTLVLYGEHEQVCDAGMHSEIASAIPGAQLAAVPGAGHLSPLDNPEFVTAALEQWLSFDPNLNRSHPHVSTPTPSASLP